ncbi:MAG: uracil-DNA glycosylase [Rhizorhabdus sp.]|nr:uracil-DNA glycosylase [Rhizorhabdus sp.]
MIRVRLDRPDDFDGWRDAARRLALAGIAPDAVLWDVAGAEADLFGGSDPLPAIPADAPPLAVSRRFVSLAERVVCHRDPERFALLYTLLMRLRDDPHRIDHQADPLNRRLELMAKDIGRDIHKMHAFVRFREVGDNVFVAWFEPDHHIVRINAGFFIRRYANMTWSILTPELSIHWDGKTLRETPGATRADAPEGDPVEDLWKSYYASIFNPARLKVDMMVKEMPRRYWANMPETALIPSMIAGAQAREAAMVEEARMGRGDTKAWGKLRDEAAHCTRCDLHCHATQTVFGEGPVDAPLMFVGEQPGDQEDLAGKPFVGPAGQMFDRAMADAGVDRAKAYVTNAVKHFKFEQRGKRRIHAKPNGGEISACRWWIDQERLIVKPKRIVMLGTTAIHSLTGRAQTLMAMRGRELALPDGTSARATVHPSFLLRMPDKARVEEEYARFVEDLKAAADGV